jgi:hypothetical protein
MNIQLALNKTQLSKVSFHIPAHPLYEVPIEDYQEMHNFKMKTKASLTDMHVRVNALKEIQNTIVSILKDLPEEEKYNKVQSEGAAILQKLQSWDEDMVQRKSKAYDGVEHFPNKFTAEYRFLINQNDNDIPKVNQASKDRLVELDKRWEVSRSRSEELIRNDIPAYNKLLWDHGIGALKAN